MRLRKFGRQSKEGFMLATGSNPQTRASLRSINSKRHVRSTAMTMMPKRQGPRIPKRSNRAPPTGGPTSWLSIVETWGRDRHECDEDLPYRKARHSQAKITYATFERVHTAFRSLNLRPTFSSGTVSHLRKEIRVRVDIARIVLH
jgi:hypothetical protein